MKIHRLILLPTVALLATGCPHKEYTVDLTPRGDVIERKLTFYQADGVDTNGVPNYQGFPADELAAIARLYPRTGLKHEGERHTASGDFANVMPADIGGAGYYTNYSTPLGSASFYLERFRGNDDYAGVITRKLKAADRLTDLVIGWSHQEFGREPHYANLKKFLDVEFRRDFKNLVLYWWRGQAESLSQTNSTEEFIARSAQYLIEHGYVKPADLPDIAHGFMAGDDKRVTRLMQRLVASKLGVLDSQPVPKSLAFLQDADAVSKSWEKYLSTTEEYRERLWKWRREKIFSTHLTWGYLTDQTGNIFRSKNTDAPPAGPPKPQPTEIAGHLFEDLLQFETGTDDSLTVNLSLPVPPLQSNGKWDATNKVMRWTSNLPNAVDGPRPPVLCFAAWSMPDESFQRQHFGLVILTGNELASYCIWRAGLGPAQIAEWDAFLATLTPGAEMEPMLSAFQFSNKTPATPPGKPDAAAFGRDIIRSALYQAKNPGPK